ncbi:MAG: right-handed parallel beta-helix repeat-containing protein, partial [Phycisphaerae bacterium]
PDECEADCNANGVPDSCDLASGAALDCNANDIPDSCDIAAGGGSDDCNNNQRPDECDLAAGGGSDDCNSNRVPDECDYAAGTLHDCNANQQADACELSPCRYETELVARTPPGPDPTVLGPPDGIGHDIQGMSLTFRFTCGRLYNGPGPDLNVYEVPGGHGLGNLANQVHVSADGVTWYDISQAFAHAGATHIPGDGYRPAGSYSLPSVLRHATYVRISYYGVVGFGIVLDAIGAIHAWVPDDCNGNGSPDGCDLGAGTSTDADGNGKPDECDADCDADGVPNSFELAFGLELDCNANNVPDDCEPDCDGDGVPDVCEPNNNLILRADAGPDGSICAGESLVLGGSPSAVNGVAPYAYQWFADGQPKEPPALDQQQPQATGDVFTGGAAQTFIAGQTGELRAVEVWFSADSGSGTLFIHAGNYGTVLSVQGVNAPAGWQRFELNCPVPVTAGQEYMLRLTGALNIKYHAGNPYPAGTLNGNNTWDMAFKTYVGRLTGLCGGTEANPTVRPVQSTRYQLQVTDADQCRQMDEVLVTVRPEPCLRLSGFTVGGERPYVLGQVVPVTVNLSVPAPAGGVDVAVNAGGFAGFLMHVPEGLDGSQRDVTMQSLGTGLSATARIVDLGAPLSSSTYDVLPMVQSLALESLPPYRVGDALPLSVTLREPAIAGGAVVRVTSPAFDPFDINIPEGQTQGQEQVVLRVVGSGLTATAAGQTRCTRTAVSAPFDVLPAGELYVDAVTGSDANDGLTPGTALATINQALALAAEGFVIHVAAGNYSERVVVNKNVVLAGAGADRTVVDAGHNGRPLTVHAPSVAISDMAFTNGTTTGDFFDAVGGGVYVGAVNDLLLRRCHIHGNTAGGPGGGIYVSFAGQVSLVDCTISHNTGGVFGGGIFSYATLRLTQCTVSGNALGAAELGNSFGGGVVSAGETYISHCTITGNSAAIGGGISPWHSTRLGHTLVAGNVSSLNIGPDLDDSSNAVFISEGYNLIGTAPPMAAAAGDLFGIEPRLAPLALYGGTVPTHALRSGSPAIDAGNPADCADLGGAPAALDQRGRNRPFDGDGDGQPRCDIGAFERTSPPADFDGDEDVDATDLEALRACLSAPAIPRSPPCQAQDLDGDNDVDQTDHALFQRCYNGKDRPPAPTCGT